MASTADQTNYFSGYYNVSPGIASVGSYQVSGTPFVTGSTTLAQGGEDRINFPGVTKSVTIINRPSGSGDAPDIRIHFAPTGSNNVVIGNHFITLTAGKDSMTMNVKCKELYISRDDAIAGNAAYQVFAEITGINIDNMFPLTGSGISE